MNKEVIEKTAHKVKIYGDLDEVAKKLQVFKSAELNVYVDFNGKKLYSLLDDLDSCYVKVTGSTKAEFDEAERLWRENYEKQEAEEKANAKKMLPTYIEQGKSLVYAQKLSDWKKCVRSRVSDLYHGKDLANAIEAMTEIDKSGDFLTAKSIIDKANHSGASYGMVMRVILNFSKKGPDFYEYMEPEYSKSPETKKVLDQIRKENEKYQLELDKGSQPGA